MHSVGCVFRRAWRAESGELGRTEYEHQGFRAGLQHLSGCCKQSDFSWKPRHLDLTVPALPGTHKGGKE